jgi:hypothetical protein
MSQKIVRINQNLYVSEEIFSFLATSTSYLSSTILNATTGDKICFLDFAGDNEMIETIQTCKVEDLENLSTNLGNYKRSKMKIGKIVSKLFSKKELEYYSINDSMIETFVDCYKSFFDRSNIKFEIIEGEEIKKWYYENNYFVPENVKTSTLWKSCMRYYERIKFLDLYTKNPKIKMVALFTEQNGTQKVRSRALLWHDVEVLSGYDLPKVNVMDRIYSSFSSDVPLFKKWAENNNYLSKWEQNSKTHVFFDVKGEFKKIKMRFNLDVKHLNYYPYLDTFTFFDYRNGVLYNDQYNPNWNYKLVQTDGSLEKVEYNNDEEEVFYDDDF